MNTTYDALDSLPRGTIVRKTVKGRTYYYHRWYEGGRRHEKFVPSSEVEKLKSLIEKRKELEGSLAYEAEASYGHECTILMGNALKDFTSPVRSWRRRDCFDRLKEYVENGVDGRILILFGLRRTGKTTLIRQVIADMTDDGLSSCAFIQITPGNTLAMLNRDLKTLSRQGICRVFIDEITLLDDFIEGSALLADIFASSGMRIVLSGTDSLGFVFATNGALYDRAIMLHTTHIPYREFSRVLGISGIDEYIRYGGIMSISGAHYNPFSSSMKVDEYIESAIAGNIQRSLECYQDGGHFRLLRELYDKGELTGAINRVVEDMNHRFALDVLVRDFRSGDLKLSARNLRMDRTQPNTILDDIDTSLITERFRQALEIRNRNEMSVTVDEEHARQIREYLELLDLIHMIPVIHLPSSDRSGVRAVITQPGLRHAQVEALLESLIQDRIFDNLPAKTKAAVSSRIRTTVLGRMMEDIILMETSLAMGNCKVFTIQFPVGEFDMVIHDPSDISCRIFEIKHSTTMDVSQIRFLKDEHKCAQTEFRYGRITGRYVIYRGEDGELDGVEYLNAERYLESLGQLANNGA